MIIMEFDEMKKIWDSQNNKPIYGIDEESLHRRILAKHKQAHHIANISELLCIFVYAGSGCFILALNFSGQRGGIFMYILAAWMLASALYLLVSRIRRINAGRQYDKSMLGDLTQAVSVTKYQENISRLMRWNIVPIALFTLLGILGSGKSPWIAVGILFFFILVYYISGWEHGIYKARKRELEVLLEKLKNEEQIEPVS